MKNCAIVGINWGDEGKGRMVDLLTEDYDIVVRYQGGGNAGHTVVNDKGKFALHLLPSGILRPGVVNILGNGVALDPENLWAEMEDVRSKGVDITPENLKISDRASLLLPWHRDLDALEEQRLGDKKYGSTKQGIAPFYSDKYQKKTILAGELFYPDELRAHLEDLLEWKDLTLTRVYGSKPYTAEELLSWLRQYGEAIKPFVCDTGAYLKEAQAAGKNILFEAQLGALRDLDYGIYPYTTSSNTLAAYAPIGAGLPSLKLTEVSGVVKAYSTCVGEGPFVSEMGGEEADKLREGGRIRRQDGPGPPGGGPGPGGHPLRGGGAGRHEDRPHQAGRAELYGEDPRLREIPRGGQGDGLFPLPHRAGVRPAGDRILGGLGLRYFRRTALGGPAGGGQGLCAKDRGGRGLPHFLRLRGRGAG